MKTIWILLTILGVLGVLMGCVMFGDIGIACFVCALSALLSGIGFAIVCRKIRSRGSLQSSDDQAKEGLGEGEAKQSKKKSWYVCAAVTSVVVVLFVCVAIFSSSGGRAPSTEKAAAADLAEEVKSGEQVLALLKHDEESTSLQRGEELSRFEGKNIIIQGKVEKVGQAFLRHNSCVVLNVGGEMFGEIDIQFDVVNSAEQEAKALSNGQLVVMRGRITSKGKFPESPFVKLQCDNAEIVPEAKYKEVIGHSSVEQMTSAELSEEVKSGEQMLAWLKTAEELTDQQRSEALSRFEGKDIIMQGVVKEFNDIFDAELKVGEDESALGGIEVKFEVANSALQGAKTLCKGQLIVMRGRVTRRIKSYGPKLVCDNAEIVPDAKYKGVIDSFSVEQMASAELAEGVKLGNRMLAWTKIAEKLTDQQRSEALSRFEGKNIIIQGIVEEVKDVFEAKLKVGEEYADRVKFEVANSALQRTKALRKGQLAVMRGRVTRRKGSFVKLVCDNAQIVPEAKYKEVIGLAKLQCDNAEIVPETKYRKR